MSIIEEVKSILSNPNDDGQAINDLVNEFYYGRNPIEIIELIDHEDENIVCQGLYLLNEISVSYYDNAEFTSRLWDLVDHEAPIIRWYAFGAIFPLLNKEDESTFELIQKIKNDKNKGVRMRGEAAEERLREQDTIH